MLDISSSLEDDFLDLVEFAQSKEGFHFGAKGLLGDDYKELGEQIVNENRPKLKVKLDSYFEGFDAQ
jgi:hypothetical protein